MKYVLKDWRAAIFVPVHKKGEPAYTSYYRPIVVTLHACKMIEAAIAKAIRKWYTFEEARPAFQQETGCETTVVGHTGNARRLPITAALDLKEAYNSVPRDKSLKLVEEELTSDLDNMIAATL